MSHFLLVYEIRDDEEDLLRSNQLLWRVNLYFDKMCENIQRTLSALMGKVFVYFLIKELCAILPFSLREDQINFAVLSKNQDKSLIRTQIGAH